MRCTPKPTKKDEDGPLEGQSCFDEIAPTV
jgi:hypothetical protein